MANEVLEKDVRDAITAHLRADKRSLKYLHEETNIPYGTLYSCFVEKRFSLNEDNLKKINEVLGTDFK